MQEVKKANEQTKLLAVTYIRVARAMRDRINGGFTKKYQRAAFRADAEKNDIDIIAEFADIGSSAKEKRPGLARMFDYIKKNKVDFVYIYALDRLSRNMVDLWGMIATIEDAGAKVMFMERDGDFQVFSKTDFFPSMQE